MDQEKMFDSNGQLSEEFKAQGLQLVQDIAAVCKGKEPVLVMFVLEAILTEQISIYSEPLGELFSEMMKVYKQKATMMLQIMDMLREAGDQYVGQQEQTTEPQE